MTHQMVTCNATVIVHEPGTSPMLVDARLDCSPEKPGVVVAGFEFGGRRIEWAFSRGRLQDSWLLACGIGAGPCGTGEGLILLDLIAPIGPVRLQLAATEIGDFLDRADDLERLGSAACSS